MSAHVYGKVKWFDQNKGYGFITRDDGQKDVFVHATDVRKSKLDVEEFGEGDRVVFEIDGGKDGKTKAVNIALDS